MATISKFAIHYHEADKAGNHHDIRFKQPSGSNWDSFATKKEIPMKTGDKIMVYRTRVHSEKEALFVGEIEKGKYGAGKLSLFDSGKCEFERYSSRHVAVRFYGKKIKGLYHFISIAYTRGKTVDRYGKKAYLFFKGKEG